MKQFIGKTLIGKDAIQDARLNSGRVIGWTYVRADDEDPRRDTWLYLYNGVEITDPKTIASLYE